MKRGLKLGLTCVAMLIATGGQARAGMIVNGGFESGVFGSEWSTIGITSVEDSGFGTGPSSGTYQALMRTGDGENPGEGGGAASSSIDTFLGLSAGSIDALSSGTTTEGSAIKQEITGSIGDTFSFDWNFLTNELTPQPTNFNDFAFWSLVSKNDGELLADTFFPTFSISGTLFEEETGYNTTTFTLPSTGTFTLGFGVMNVDDYLIESGLLIDNVTAVTSAPIPEPSSLAIFGIGACMAGVGVARRRRRERQHEVTV